MGYCCERPFHDVFEMTMGVFRTLGWKAVEFSELKALRALGYSAGAGKTKGLRAADEGGFAWEASEGSLGVP